MKFNLLRIIKEEIQDYFSDWRGDEEPSIADKYYEKRGIAPTKTEEINAEVFGYVNKQYDKILNPPIPVYKNPKSLQGFKDNTRGILLSNGDLYLAQSYNALHDNILDMLADKGVISYASKYGYEQNYPKDFVAVVRAGNTKTFGQSSAYDDFPRHYITIFDVGNEIQPFTFHQYSF